MRIIVIWYGDPLIQIILIYKSVAHVANSMPEYYKFLYANKMPTFYKIAVYSKVNVLILGVGYGVKWGLKSITGRFSKFEHFSKS